MSEVERPLEDFTRRVSQTAGTGDIYAATRQAQELERESRAVARRYLEGQINASASRAQQEMAAGRLRPAEAALEQAKSLRARLSDF